MLRTFQIQVIVDLWGDGLAAFEALTDAERHAARQQAAENLLGSTSDARQRFTELHRGWPWRGQVGCEEVSRMPEPVDAEDRFRHAAREFGERGFPTTMEASSEWHQEPSERSDPHSRVRALMAEGRYYTCVRYEIIDGQVVAIYNTTLRVHRREGGEEVRPFSGFEPAIAARYHMTMRIPLTVRPSLPVDLGLLPVQPGVLVDVWGPAIRHYTNLQDNHRGELQRGSRETLLGNGGNQWDGFWQDRRGEIPAYESRLPGVDDAVSRIHRAVEDYNRSADFPLDLALDPDPRPYPLVGLGLEEDAADLWARVESLEGDAREDAEEDIRTLGRKLTSLRLQVPGYEELASGDVEAVYHVGLSAKRNGEPVGPVSEEFHAEHRTRALFLAFLQVKRP